MTRSRRATPVGRDAARTTTLSLLVALAGCAGPVAPREAATEPQPGLEAAPAPSGPSDVVPGRPSPEAGPGATPPPVRPEEEAGPGGEGPAVRAEEAHLFFGEIGYGGEAVQQLVLASTGDEAVSLTSVTLEAAEGTAFSLSGPSAPLSLPPGRDAVFEVRFRPGDGRGVPARRFADAVLVDAEGLPPLRIGLAGVASHEPELCLAFEPARADLGFTEPGGTAAAELELVNCGRAEVRVAGLVIEPQVEALALAWDGAPFDLAARQGRPVTVTHRPSDLSPLKARLAATTASGLRALAPIRSSPPPCPVAAGGARLGDGPLLGDAVVSVGNEVRLDGRASKDAAPGFELAHSWSLESPTESAGPELLPEADAADVAFVPDVPGRYAATLEVRSVTTGRAGCEPLAVVVDALPRTTLRVSLTWADQADLDLHLVRSDRGGEPFVDHEGGPDEDARQRCNAVQRSPDWGRRGVGADDPRHLGDDLDGFGPEVVELPVLEGDRRYRVGVRYSRPGPVPVVPATVTIEHPGGELARVTRTLWQHGAFWIPFVVDGDGGVRLVDAASLD